jgi:tetratricopeptide (TPR) repeat protein
MRAAPDQVVLVMLTLATVGCQLPGGRGPMSRSLLASRQLCQQGVSAIEDGRWQQAEKLLAQAVQTCPEDPDARRQYADVLWHRDQQGQAIAQLEEACRLDINSASLRVRLAEVRLAVGQVELADRSVQSALDRNPKLAEAWAVRGRVMRAKGRLGQALGDYQRALGLSPEDRTVQLEIAELYGQLDQPQRALATLHDLADTYSPGEEPQQVLHLEGLAYAALERWDAAAESLSAACTRGQPTPEILFRLGRAELLAGRPAAAAAAAREALALDPRHQPSRDLLGHVESVLGSEEPRRR